MPFEMSMHSAPRRRSERTGATRTLEKRVPFLNRLTRFDWTIDCREAPAMAMAS